MLRQLVIHDVVLIDRLELEFEPGLGALTGETGAGKSILLDSLGLALGIRADAGLVRAGQAAASVSAEIELPHGHPAFAAMAEQGIECDPGEPLLLRRTLKADGGSRAFAGGAAVPATLLRDIAGSLIEIHGQHDDRGLLNPKGHRALLDAFGKLDTGAVEAAWARRSALEAELAGQRQALAEADRDREWLDFAIDEIAALEVEEGEEERLADARGQMKAAARIEDDLGALDQHYTGSDGGLSQLRQAARRLERIADAHPLLAEALVATDRAIIEADEAEAKIAAAKAALAHSPIDLESAEARLFEIRGLARKHRVEADQLPVLLDDMRARRAAIDQGSERIEQLERALAAAKAQFETSSKALSEARKISAEQLDHAVAGELAPLKLDSARFRTALASTEPGPSGSDRVEFEVSTNPGAPFGALTKIASGGEMSRFILALKVALAEAGGARTMIFDEVDRGVGGAVASAIGERLARLAVDAQVLVVTHSPQVAARAAHHYRIE
ncbi:MAG: DNA repair protein RecN, partial [Sphingomicrobium sp.]